jgi:hypothetical protein
MFLPFENLDDRSRIWIYQANRQLTTAEEDVVRDVVRAHCDQWMAHGHDLSTSFRIDHRLFLILAVDEGVTAASGCSIDGSVNMLKRLQDQLGLDFFDRSMAAFPGKGDVKLMPLRELKEAFRAGILNPATLTFNTQVFTLGDLKGRWIMPVENTWLVKYLPTSAVA